MGSRGGIGHRRLGARDAFAGGRTLGRSCGLHRRLGVDGPGGPNGGPGPKVREIPGHSQSLRDGRPRRDLPALPSRSSRGGSGWRGHRLARLRRFRSGGKPPSRAEGPPADAPLGGGRGIALSSPPDTPAFRARTAFPRWAAVFAGSLALILALGILLLVARPHRARVFMPAPSDSSGTVTAEIADLRREPSAAGAPAR